MNKKSQNSFEWSAEDPGNSRRQEALLLAHPALRTPHSTLQRASSRRLLLRLALGLFNAGLGCATPAAAQTNCSACWTAITNWQGSFTLSVSGGPQGDGWSGQVNNTSQGTFWITNGTHGVHGPGSISSSAEHAGCCGSGCATYYASCNTAASGALDAFVRVGVKIDSANCSYSL